MGRCVAGQVEGLANVSSDEPGLPITGDRAEVQARGEGEGGQVLLRRWTLGLPTFGYAPWSAST